MDATLAVLAIVAAFSFTHHFVRFNRRRRLERACAAIGLKVRPGDTEKEMREKLRAFYSSVLG